MTRECSAISFDLHYLLHEKSSDAGLRALSGPKYCQRRHIAYGAPSKHTTPFNGSELLVGAV